MHAEAPTSESSLGGRLAVWIATGVGVGLVSPAPGTVGGLWGLALTWAIFHVPDPAGQAAAIAALIIAAAGVCGAAARALGAESDPQPVVLDEIVVTPIVYLGGGPLNWRLLAAGYLLFRLFDVWKPGAAREAEKLPGGWGIVADDLVAAALAWAFLRGALWIDRTIDLNWLTAI
jgi:phosphatidylglycerophosphatase A